MARTHRPPSWPQRHMQSGEASMHLSRHLAHASFKWRRRPEHRDPLESTLRPRPPAIIDSMRSS
eukprot:scaffold170820_cov31-Tisochrysis_lutea.AAC.4